MSVWDPPSSPHNRTVETKRWVFILGQALELDQPVFHDFLHLCPLYGKKTDPPAVLYYLSGFSCTEENARTKSNFMNKAREYRIAVVFPYTSPRDVKIKGVSDVYSFGLGGVQAFIDATEHKNKNNLNMYT